MHDSDNFIGRFTCLQTGGFDVLGVAETHLKGGQKLDLPGYAWIGNNRKATHVNAIRGSGGVGFCINEQLLDIFNVSLLDDSVDDILWIKLTHKMEAMVVLCLCVCYLAPANSSRQICANNYYDTLLNSVYEYQSVGRVVICGDFNGRIGDRADYIEGIDSLPERKIMDFTVNSHGESLLEFLLCSSMCVLNGRGISDNYTCVTHNGASVVDYCLVPHESFHQIQKFSVTTAREVYSQAGCEEMVDVTHTLPDHALLSWHFCLTDVTSNIGTSFSKPVLPEIKKTKFNFMKIPENFMCNPDSVLGVGDLIIKLNSPDVSFTQETCDEIYRDFVNAVQGEMLKYIPHRQIVLGGLRDKQYVKSKKSKPWWSEELSTKWNDCKRAEKSWLCDKKDKQKKNVYVTSRKDFDKCVQKSKRSFWRKRQDEIVQSQNNPREFWKKVNNLGVCSGRKRNNIPHEVLDENGDVITDSQLVMTKWQNDFSHLYNQTNVQADDAAMAPLGDVNEPIDLEDIGSEINGDISREDVEIALKLAKKGKAVGNDEIPVEVLCNKISADFLCIFFQKCFRHGISPSEWAKGIISPIPKSNTTDVRDPMQYRGLTITSCVYKLFCSILHSRLKKWCEVHGILVDEQNGFRSGRGTLDHIYSLCSLVETRKLNRPSTYAVFVDFRQAYDRINRKYLFKKLQKLGIYGEMLTIIGAVYKGCQCCVRLNGRCTDWFKVDSGLKQGCLLSPILFSLYINDLAQEIKQLGCGVNIGDCKLSILLYADDIVMLAESETDLQAMLICLSEWCIKWELLVNQKKSQVVHFRPQAMPMTEVSFSCGETVLDIVLHYKYLGLLVTDHVDYNIAVKAIAQSATRALGGVKVKYKSRGGLPYETFKKLFDVLVWSVLNYSSPVWGTQEFSCVNSVFNEACRYHLGAGKYTPTAAVRGEMGWQTPKQRLWISVGKLYCRFRAMDDSRINKKVFTWCSESKSHNWHWRVKQQFAKLGLSYLLEECLYLS